MALEGSDQGVADFVATVFFSSSDKMAFFFW